MLKEHPSVSSQSRKFVAEDFFDKSGSHTQIGQIMSGMKNRIDVFYMRGIGQRKPIEKVKTIIIKGKVVERTFKADRSVLNPNILQQVYDETLSRCESVGIPQDFQEARLAVEQYENIADEVNRRRLLSECVYQSPNGHVDKVSRVVTIISDER